MFASQLSTLTDEAMRAVTRLDLPYRCYEPTRGDGNCLFRAIIDQMRNPHILATISERAKNIERNHHALRQAIVDFCEYDCNLHQTDTFQLHKTVYINEAQKPGESNDTTWKRCLQNMRRDSVFAEDIFIESTAIFLQKDIKLVSPQQTKQHPWTTISGNPITPGQPITLAYLPGRHFQSIHSIKNDKCLGCGTQINKLLCHLAKKSACKSFYNIDKIRKEARETHEQQKSAYKEKNREKVQRKHSKYNEENRETIQQKQTRYNRENRETIQQKHVAYNKENREYIQQKQASYNKENRECIQQKQASYNKENRDCIQQKKASYNKENRDCIQQKQASYNKENRDCIQQKQASYNKENRDCIQQKQASYNKENRVSINLKQSFYRKIQFHNADEQARFQSFQNDIKEGLSYPCVCCHRIFFKNSVSSVNLENLKLILDQNAEGLYEASIKTPLPECMFAHGKTYLCHTCNTNYLKKFKRPPLSYLNGLQVEHIPELNVLSELENTLIAKNIIFLKLFQLPVSRWSAVKDKIVNVPITNNDLLNTLSSLNSFPRTLDEAGLIPVQLKRKLEYKNKVLEAYINPENLVRALKCLKEAGHPSYQNIVIQDHYSAQTNDDSISSKAESADSDNDDDKLDSIRKYQHNLGNSTMMTDNFPESSLITNTTNNILHQKESENSTRSCPIAPGEGKVPTNLMRDENWLINAFPNLFPSGKYGLNYERDQKISPQQYILQRLQNVDKRFCNNKALVFAFLYFLERQQMETQINLSYRRGKLVENRLTNIEDGFAVFDKILGTPRYWQQKRYEVIARLEQLGAFQFFFTLSCADKRWEENFTSILIQKGLNVTFKRKVMPDKTCYYSDDILVNGNTPR